MVERVTLPMIFSQCSLAVVRAAEDVVVVVLRKVKILYTVLRLLWKTYTTERLFVSPSLETNLAPIARAEEARRARRRPALIAMVVVSAYH